MLIVMDSKEVMVGMSPISDDELNSKSAVSALLGRHHNIHPKHPNHSLTIAVTMAVGIFVNFSTPK